MGYSLDLETVEGIVLVQESRPKE